MCKMAYAGKGSQTHKTGGKSFSPLLALSRETWTICPQLYPHPVTLLLRILAFPDPTVNV